MNAIWLIGIPAAPLAAALVILIFGRRLGQGNGIVNLLGTAVSLVCLAVLAGRLPVTITAPWGAPGGFSLTAGLLLDDLSFFAAVFVAGVAFFVTLYAWGYMAEEEGRQRFFALFAFFTGAMLALVLAGSFIILFAAWEWVGLASFLLIGFWYGKAGVPRASRLAFLVTRLGDAGFLLGWVWALTLTGTTDLDAFLAAVEGGAGHGAIHGWIAFMILLGAAGKSAQLPLSAWLPPAMAGPTPVSALIHSATMVAAGVYLMLRLYPLFEVSGWVLTTVAWVGGGTALCAALVATVQADLKRVLAWSTISQVGEMVLAVGLATPLAAMFHLTTHGTFKATLFLAAGAVEHGSGSRRLERLGGLLQKMPVTGGVFIAAALALAGVWPFSGYFSEDRILAGAAHQGRWTGFFMLVLIFLAGTYISRAGMAVFGKWPHAPVPKAHETGKRMQAGMIGLALPAVFLGWGLSHSIEDLLPFQEGAGLAGGWKIAASLAALGGIAWGAYRVRRRGPVPALGGFPRVLEAGINRATDGVGTAAVAASRGLELAEAGLARGAMAVKQGGLGMAALINALEEKGFSRGGDRLVEFFRRTARGSDVLEGSGFSRGLDRFAGLFGRAGRRLLLLQTGKLYLYTMGLFIWMLAVLLLCVLALWGF